MTEQAELEDAGSGLVPTGPGWFVVNAADAAWVRNPAFNARAAFEAGPRVLRERPDLGEQRFPEVGITLAVLEPGRPSGIYHTESAQEDFLVLSGECRLLIEEQERSLRAWDFVHCPAGTHHAFIGAGGGPCVLLMIGARPPGRTLSYPASPVAREHGVGVAETTSDPGVAYAGRPGWEVARPDSWTQLPWARAAGDGG
jgi:uncharacterized cupin superfamily protein